MYAASESTECRQRYVARQCSGGRPSHWKHHSQSLPRCSNACSSPNLSPTNGNAFSFARTSAESSGVREFDEYLTWCWRERLGNRLFALYFLWLAWRSSVLSGPIQRWSSLCFHVWFSGIWYIDRPHLTPRIGSYPKSTFSHRLVKKISSFLK